MTNMTTDETNIVSGPDKFPAEEALSAHEESSSSFPLASQRAEKRRVPHWVTDEEWEAILPEEEEKDSLKEEGAGPQKTGNSGGTLSLKSNASNGMSLKKILGGDILTNDFFRRQIKLLVLLVIFAIIYISNRYSCQQEMIEIDQLKKELTDIKYDALTRSSELTEKSRQSHIEEYVSQEGSALQTSTNPPYLIK